MRPRGRAMLPFLSAGVVWLVVGLAHGLIGYPGRAPSARYGVVMAAAGLGAALLMSVLIWLVATQGLGYRGSLVALAAQVAWAQAPLALEALAAVLLTNPGWVQVPGYALGVATLLFLFPAGLVGAVRVAFGAPVWASLLLALPAWYAWLMLVWKPALTFRF